MRGIQVGLIVLLSAASAVAADTHLFYVGMSGNDSTCVGAVVTLGGSQYTVKLETPVQLVGPTQSPFDSGSPVTVTPVWNAGGTDQHGTPCGASSYDLCPTKQFALSNGAFGTVCTMAADSTTNREIVYGVAQGTAGGRTYWQVRLSSNVGGSTP